MNGNIFGGAEALVI